MYRAFLSVRRKSSHLALAIALATGGAVASAAYAPAAIAQEDRDFSEAFAAAYQPVADMVTNETPDWQGARARVDAVIASASTPDDLFVVGNLAQAIGQNMQDAGLRQRGIQLMLQSGKLPAADIPRYHYYNAQFAFNAGDYAAARTALDAAVAAGYVDADSDPANDPAYIYAQSYAAEENFPASIAYLSQEAERRLAAGQPVPERWLLRALQDSYDNDLRNEAVTVSQLLLRNNNAQQNWTNALQVVRALYEFQPATRVDLYRLMDATGTISSSQEYFNFADDLDPRIMGSEVLAVLQRGVDSGVIDAGDAYLVELRGIATPRAAGDRSEVNDYISEAESGDARTAFSTGDVLYSLERYDDAERFYQLALDRGFDADAARLRLGIAQTQQGNYTAAKANFEQIAGERDPIAKLWAAYADTMMNQ
ncbi:hypothetical protein [Aurantiacibacter aquimixticola]|uniref:Uncharacterized protein n=1 Tax=Aurantiacibacter aquimixticola TaxID=1958945 RepID=A0A419RRY1_9SPHN|nr:hypothetical protein [Aurantiacibacter aquimixticola]RJY08526.1 hypothetical protein D6201_03365 [Aurantiacibacter aquimixticola]